MRRLVFCGAALLFGVYLALRLGGAAMALSEAQMEVARLQSECRTAQGTLSTLRQDAAISDEALRVLAWRLWGLASPEDTVFFDGGAWSGGSWPQK